MHIHTYTFKTGTVGGSRQQDQPQQDIQRLPQQGQGVCVCVYACVLAHVCLTYICMWYIWQAKYICTQLVN